MKNHRCSAMVLAAGRGERMRPLTDTTPKPLLAVRGKPLMQWHLEALARGGFDRVLVNTAWLGGQIESHFDHEPTWNGACVLSNQEPLRLVYSHEGQDFGGALETAGGICRALPLLDDIFWVVAGDVFAPGFAFSRAAVERFEASDKLAHIWLVPNPDHHPRGDFGLSETGLALSHADRQFTFSTIALYRRAFFASPWTTIPPGNPDGVKAALAPMLRAAMDHGQVSAELYTGDWADVGTPERLERLG
jgi:MurNAc alpha-1-phosphate uridylyltransferase